jgi:hypothetical protein
MRITSVPSKGITAASPRISAGLPTIAPASGTVNVIAWRTGVAVGVDDGSGVTVGATGSAVSGKVVGSGAATVGEGSAPSGVGEGAPPAEVVGVAVGIKGSGVGVARMSTQPESTTISSRGKAIPQRRNLIL